MNIQKYVESAFYCSKIYMDKMVRENNTTIYYSNSMDDTAYLAQKIADKLKGGEVILLNGQLGAGKTSFTKCLAKCLEVEDVVTSPTFTFMKSYSGRLALYHFDMYRAENEDELYELGLNDYLYMNGVCVIEWNKFENIQNPINIDISYYGDGETQRKFVVTGIDLDI